MLVPDNKVLSVKTINSRYRSIFDIKDESVSFAPFIYDYAMISNEQLNSRELSSYEDAIWINMGDTILHYQEIIGTIEDMLNEGENSDMNVSNDKPYILYECEYTTDAANYDSKLLKLFSEDSPISPSARAHFLAGSAIVQKPLSEIGLGDSDYYFIVIDLSGIIGSERYEIASDSSRVFIFDASAFKDANTDINAQRRFTRFLNGFKSKHNHQNTYGKILNPQYCIPAASIPANFIDLAGVEMLDMPNMPNFDTSELTRVFEGSIPSSPQKIFLSSNSNSLDKLPNKCLKLNDFGTYGVINHICSKPNIYPNSWVYLNKSYTVERDYTDAASNPSMNPKKFTEEYYLVQAPLQALENYDNYKIGETSDVGLLPNNTLTPNVLIWLPSSTVNIYVKVSVIAEKIDITTPYDASFAGIDCITNCSATIRLGTFLSSISATVIQKTASYIILEFANVSYSILNSSNTKVKFHYVLNEENTTEAIYLLDITNLGDIIISKTLLNDVYRKTISELVQTDGDITQIYYGGINGATGDWKITPVPFEIKDGKVTLTISENVHQQAINGPNYHACVGFKSETFGTFYIDTGVRAAISLSDRTLSYNTKLYKTIWGQGVMLTWGNGVDMLKSSFQNSYGQDAITNSKTFFIVDDAYYTSNKKLTTETYQYALTFNSETMVSAQAIGGKGTSAIIKQFSSNNILKQGRTFTLTVLSSSLSSFQIAEASF